MRFLLGRLCLKYFYNAVFSFLNAFYVFPVGFYHGCAKTFLNTFYNVMLEPVLVLTLAASDASTVVPGPLPGYSRRSVPNRLEVSGTVPRKTKAPRKCTTSLKQHQNPVGLNWKNLKKIAEI